MHKPVNYTLIFVLNNRPLLSSYIAHIRVDTPLILSTQLHIVMSMQYSVFTFTFTLLIYFSADGQSNLR